MSSLSNSSVSLPSVLLDVTGAQAQNQPVAPSAVTDPAGCWDAANKRIVCKGGSEIWTVELLGGHGGSTGTVGYLYLYKNAAQYLAVASYDTGATPKLKAYNGAVAITGAEYFDVRFNGAATLSDLKILLRRIA